MPEGDTVFLTAKRLDKAMAGQVLQRCDFRHPTLATLDLSGERVLGVRSVGKHLIMEFSFENPAESRFSEPMFLHSHLKMDGSWQVLSPGQRWRMPAHHARVILQTERSTAVGFRLHNLAFLPNRELDRLIGHLGPDLLDPQWTEIHQRRATENLRRDPDRELGLALLDQKSWPG
jgi:endonuclease-8